MSKDNYKDIKDNKRLCLIFFKINFIWTKSE